MNYLTDEAFDCGKGANVVISQLHHFLENHGFGETEVFLHADNCCGQNKNNIMMQYLMWRIMTKRHKSFAIISCSGTHQVLTRLVFGLLKQKYRKIDIGSVDSLAKCVDASATCNHVQLVGMSDGTLIVPTFDRSSYFAIHFRRITGIKSFHHFHFDSSCPGIDHVQERCDSEKIRISLLKDDWVPSLSASPQQIFPNGLSQERQWYLYEKIRTFCPDPEKDTTCPLPAVPKSGTPNPNPEIAVTIERLNSVPESLPDSLPSASPKAKRHCGICRKPGHNARRCPNK